MTARSSFYSYSLSSLSSRLSEVALARGFPSPPSYRASQLFQLIYRRLPSRLIAGPTVNLPREFIDFFNANFFLDDFSVLSDRKSSEDGSRKWILQLEQEKPAKDEKPPLSAFLNRPALLESVFIPMSPSGSGALCVSSQMGCAVAPCKFCRTGAIDKKSVRNLTTNEILMQFLAARRALGDVEKPFSSQKIQNVVLMGMGEPLLNAKRVFEFIKILSCPEGLAMPANRITLSTSGIVPGIEKLTEERLGVQLALSLHGWNDHLRSSIMPINDSFPIAEVLQACRKFQAAAPPRSRITMEYVLLRGVNDSPTDALGLLKLLKESRLNVLINLIPFSPWLGSNFSSPSVAEVDRFCYFLKEHSASLGFAPPVTVRWSKGRDIEAACGQLAAEVAGQQTNLLNNKTIS